MSRTAWLLCALLPLHAEMVLLTHDARGNFLKQAPAVLRKGGFALAPRDVFQGAASALILDGDGQLHRVLWITADDADSGVIEVYVGAQAPNGPDAASSLSKRVKMSGHEANVRDTREAGGFGTISRLDCGGPGDPGPGPLYDEHGLLAGWHATRSVDGQVLAFAVPLARFESVSQTLRLSIAEWNVLHDPVRESAYQRAMGYVWVDDYDGALFYFRKAVEAEPANPRAWYHLAFAEGKNGHGKNKTAYYRKAVELDPAFAPAHYYLGFSLLLNGDRNGAMEEYKKLKDLDAGWALRLKLFLDAAHVDVLDKPKAPDTAHRLA